MARPVINTYFGIFNDVLAIAKENVEIFGDDNKNLNTNKLRVD
jgi:hypothetical protein